MKLYEYIKTIDVEGLLDKPLNRVPSRANESSLSRVRKVWTEHDTGTITAFRDIEDCGDGDTIPKTEKKSRNRDLKSILLGMGYGVTKVKGSWAENGVEQNEASFFVVDINDKGSLKKDLIKLGTKYEQDAITYADAGSDYYAIGTNTCPDSWPGFGTIGKSEKLGVPKFGKTGINGYSKVNNRAFVFEGFQQEKLTDKGVGEWRSIQHHYKKYLESEV